MTITVTSYNQSGGITARTVHIHGTAPRELTSNQKDELLTSLNEYGARHVKIRYEHSQEIVIFVEKVEIFLVENGFRVSLQAVMMSEIKPGAFELSKHPTDPDWAILRIG